MLSRCDESFLLMARVLPMTNFDKKFSQAPKTKQTVNFLEVEVDQFIGKIPHQEWYWLKGMINFFADEMEEYS
jgi:hypothetical protein